LFYYLFLLSDFSSKNNIKVKLSLLGKKLQEKNRKEKVS